MAEVVNHRSATEFEAVVASNAEPVIAAETQGYRHVREDGTVEYASSREEVLELCPVLGKLATKEPETVNLLLDMAAIGQAKIPQEQRSKPEASKLTEEPIVKPPKMADVTPERPKPGTTKDNTVAPRLRNEHLEQIETTSRQVFELSTRTSEPDFAPAKESPRGTKTKKSQKSFKPATIRAKIRNEASTRKKSVIDKIMAPDQANSAKAETRIQTTTKRGESITLSHMSPVHKLPKRTVSGGKSTHRVETNKHPLQYEIKPANKKAKPAATKAEKASERRHMRNGVAAPVSHDSRAAEIDVKTDNIVLAEPVATAAASRRPELIESSSEASGQTVALVGVAEQESANEQVSLKFFDDFAGELQALVAAEVPTDENESDEQRGLVAIEQSIDKSAENSPQPESVPAITLVVAERLEELNEPDQKAAVALMLQDMVETARLTAAPETTAVQPDATEQLEEKVTALFEQLGVDYEPEDIDQFIKILPRLNPRHAAAAELQEETAEVDLEHDGTREAKWRLPRFAGSLLGTEYVAEQLLGKLALLYLSNKGRVGQFEIA